MTKNNQPRKKMTRVSKMSQQKRKLKNPKSKMMHQRVEKRLKRRSHKSYQHRSVLRNCSKSRISIDYYRKTHKLSRL